MATAVLVVERLVYVTMSDTVGPEFYSKTVNRTSRGSAVAISDGRFQPPVVVEA